MWRRDRMRLAGTCAVLALAAAMPAEATETCHYVGAGDYDSHLAITTTVSETDGLLSVDIATTMDAEWLWIRYRFLGEELSTWRGGQLQSLSVNSRSLTGAGRIIRQQWDDWRRGPGGLLARRVQAKRLDDFRLSHPGFLGHWDPSTFGQSWTGDYDAASPERRPDLDLDDNPLPDDLRSPLAEAFYWIRWARPASAEATLFLAGAKEDKTARMPVEAAPWADGLAWRARILHPKLDPRVPSTVTVWVTPEHAVAQIAMSLHGRHGAVKGVVRALGCEGAAIVPTGQDVAP